MKKFAKISLIISGAFFITGVIILIICSIFAGGRIRSKLSDTVSSKLRGIAGIGFSVPWDFSDNWSGGNFYDYGAANVHTGAYTDDKAAKASDVTELHLGLGDGKFTIARSNDEYFHIRSNGRGKCQYYTEGSAFFINAFYENKWYRWYRKNSLTLEIPDTFLKKADISVGAGSVDISSLKSDTVVINIGAGELAVENVNCTYIETGIGMGSVTIKNGSTQDASFEVGMGELIYSGNIARDLSASVDMGAMTLMLNDSQYDHNYAIDVDMGSVTLGNTEYGSFLDYAQNVDNNAGSTYSLECDMGSIEVMFNDAK